MKFRWEKCTHVDGDTDLILTLEDGREGVAAFVRPAAQDRLDHTESGWMARSMLGDFPDEDVPLPTKRAAMLKAKREFPAMWIGATPEQRDELI